MDIKIITWKTNSSHPYPYRFALDIDGERIDYVGIKNQCKTKMSAVMRAVWTKRLILRGLEFCKKPTNI